MNPILHFALHPILIPALFEAAARALAGALAVFAGLRIFRVSNVMAQKAAWGLVLAASLLMPLADALAGAAGHQACCARMAARDGIRASNSKRSISAPASVQTIAASSGQHPARSSEGAPQFLQSSSPSDSSSGDRFPATTRSFSEFNPPPDQQISPTQSRAISAQKSIVRSLGPFELATLLYVAVCAGLLLRMVYGLGMALEIWKSATPIPQISDWSAGAESTPSLERVSFFLPSPSDPASCCLPTTSSGTRRSCASSWRTRNHTFARAISICRCSPVFTPRFSGSARWAGG